MTAAYIPMLSDAQDHLASAINVLRAAMDMPMTPVVRRRIDSVVDALEAQADAIDDLEAIS